MHPTTFYRGGLNQGLRSVNPWLRSKTRRTEAHLMRLPRQRTGILSGVNAREAAELQVVLEGVPLPAQKEELLEYARSQDERSAQRLTALPDREYRSLDEVGEALAPVQPSRPEPDAARPHEESGAPPGETPTWIRAPSRAPCASAPPARSFAASGG
jgi:hypothetical protein